MGDDTQPVQFTFQLVSLGAVHFGRLEQRFEVVLLVGRQFTRRFNRLVGFRIVVVIGVDRDERLLVMDRFLNLDEKISSALSLTRGASSDTNTIRHADPRFPIAPMPPLTKTGALSDDQ